MVAEGNECFDKKQITLAIRNSTISDELGAPYLMKVYRINVRAVAL